MSRYPRATHCSLSHCGTNSVRRVNCDPMEPVTSRRHPRNMCRRTLVALFAFTAALNAQQPRITRPIDVSRRTTLASHVHQKAIPANDRGRVAPSMKLSYVTVMLTQSDAQKADLQKLLADQQNPASPDYHRWLTPAQYADRFGVAPQDIAQ